MNRSFAAVTSFGADGEALYGRRMVDTFYLYWPNTISISIYRDNDLPPWLHRFKDRHRQNGAAHGLSSRGYNFRFDAVKFAHKTAAVIDAARWCGAEILIWLDGDIVTHAPVEIDWLDALMPRGAALAWLDRVGLYPECGFYMLNLRDPAMPGILAKWQALYETDQVFDLPEWHDSFVLQQIVERSGARVASLSGDAAGTSHPLANGPLGKCLDHLKGGRKHIGRSTRADLSWPRNEAYWK